MKQKPFCHLKITDISFEELMAIIDQHIKERKALSFTRLTLKMFLKSFFNTKLREAINLIDIVVPSSKILYRFIKKTYPDYQPRLEEIKEMMVPLMREYHPFLVHFLILGGSHLGLNHLTINLKASFPELKIIGAYPKIFLERNPDDVHTVIRKSEPHVFFIGLGQGKEEMWYQENKNLIPKTVTICVDQQIDRMCNDVKDIPYRYKIANKEYIFLLKHKPYRIVDVFVWAFAWIVWKKFHRKIKKRLKKEQKQAKTL